MLSRLRLPGEPSLRRGARRERSLIVQFLSRCPKIHEWTERFDNVLGLRPVSRFFPDADRIRYVRGLNTVLNPGVCSCFVSATPPGTEDPRRVSQSELRHAFADGWKSNPLEPVRLEIRPEYRQGAFSGEDPRGWFLIATAWLNHLRRLLSPDRYFPFNPFSAVKLLASTRPHRAWKAVGCPCKSNDEFYLG